MNLDFEGLMHLLQIEEKTRGHPKLKAIHDRVMRELEKLAEDIKELPKEPEVVKQPEPVRTFVAPPVPEKHDE